MKAVLTSAHKFHDDIKERIASLGYDVIDHGSENEEFTEEEYLCDVVVGLNPFMKSKVEKFKNLRQPPQALIRYPWISLRRKE